MHSRWPILTSVSFVALGNEFLNNQLSVLVQRLTGRATECGSEGGDSCLGLTVFQFNSLFTVANILSAFGAISAGYFVDRFSTARLSYIFAGIAPLGQLLVAVSPYVGTSEQYTVIVLGQTLLGLSDGMLITLVHRVKSSWFGYNELGISFAVHTVMSRVGASLAFVLYGTLLPVLGLTGCLWIGFCVALLICLSSLWMGYLDQMQPELETWRAGIPEGGFVHETKVFATFLKRQPASLWLVVASAFFFSGTVFTFTVNAPNMFAERYSFTESRASYVAGVVYYVQVIAPLFGWTTDRYGHRDIWLLAAGITVVAGIFVAYATAVPPGVYAVLIGLGDAAYSVASTSCVSIIAGNGASGKAFGLLKFLDSLGQGFFTGVAGALLIPTVGSHPWIRFLALLSAASLTATGFLIGLFIFNRLSGSSLSHSQLERNLVRDTERESLTLSPTLKPEHSDVSSQIRWTAALSAGKNSPADYRTFAFTDRPQ